MDAFDAWFPHVRAIRREVFVEEQAVPEELEVDGNDPICRHFVVYASAAGFDLPNQATSEDLTVEDLTVGTARLRELSFPHNQAPADASERLHGERAVRRVAKVERVAVRASYRGRGAGSALMDAIEALAREDGLTELVLSAQRPVVEWYARRGYVSEGSRFMEAGIEHQKMRIFLS